MTVSISRNNTLGPPSFRMPTSAAIGNPMYIDGNSDAETETSASGPPRHAPRLDAATATSAVIIPISSAPARPLLATTRAVANPAVLFETLRRLAWASATTSLTARTAMRNPTRKNKTGGANQTTPTASAMRTAPLRTRVTRSPWDWGLGTRGLGTASFHADRHRRRLDAAVAAVALLIGE